MSYTVKAVSAIAGVSVRTLHYYDEIGLLQPEQVTAAGYRLYTEEDIERLQQILFFRELEFSLVDIRQLMSAPDYDRRATLLMQRQQLIERRKRLERLVRTIDHTLEVMEGGTAMNEKELKELFDGFDHSQYEEEVRRKYDKRLVDESHRRTSKYTRQDWEAIKAEGTAIVNGLAGLMDRNPSDPEVQEWIRRHHQQINDRFYPCSLEVFRGLGDLYVQDERFGQNYEQVKPGLAAFMRAAMHAYCDR